VSLQNRSRNCLLAQSAILPAVPRSTRLEVHALRVAEISQSEYLEPVLDSRTTNTVVIRRAIPDPDVEGIRGPNRRSPNWSGAE
jgi:hypothetical protein